MSLSLYEVTVPSLLGALTSLKATLEKGAAHADANKLDANALLYARLYPDMLTFTRQIQVACDSARRGSDRLVGREPSSVEDNEKTFAELIARVDATMDHIKALERTAVDESQDRSFNVPIGSMSLDFTGRSYVLGYMVPNVLFHVTTAYDILRHNGVVLGKRDYLGPFVAGQM